MSASEVTVGRKVRSIARSLAVIADDLEITPGTALERGESRIGDEASACATMLACAEFIRWANRQGDQFLGHALPREPAWEIMLVLFVNRLRDVRLSTSRLCWASRLPDKTGRRRIAQLTEAGLVESIASQTNRRASYPVLTERGFDAMAGYFETVIVQLRAVDVLPASDKQP